MPSQAGYAADVISVFCFRLALGKVLLVIVAAYPDPLLQVLTSKILNHVA